MRFINPCKKCLVRPACTVICEARHRNIRTVESFFEVGPAIIIVIMATVSLSWVWV